MQEYTKQNIIDLVDIGKKIIRPCHFECQREYVRNILENEIDKRIGTDKNYLYIDELPNNWASYDVQKTLNADGSPTERTIRKIMVGKKRDIILADEKLKNDIPKLMKRGTEPKAMACDSITQEEYKEMTSETFEF